MGSSSHHAIKSGQLGLALLVAIGGVAGVVAEEALFTSRRLTPAGEYSGGIEGPAVDAAGNLYAVGIKKKGVDPKKQGTIGKLKPGATKSEVFAVLSLGRIGNGIRFDRDGRMYVADFKGNSVLAFEPGQTVSSIYFTSDRFNQPNDLAIAADGTLYASDPSFPRKTGQIWRITRGPDRKGRGEIMASERQMGTTNGLDLSPDGQTLYVSESNTREIWAYRLDGAKLTAPRLVKKFGAAELDGLRTDVDGRIFVTRPGNGTIALLTPDGTVVREIPTRGRDPSNLTFGGPDGETVFVTQVDGGFLETFRVDRPGREPCLQFAGALC